MCLPVGRRITNWSPRKNSLRMIQVQIQILLEFHVLVYQLVVDFSAPSGTLRSYIHM